MRRLFLLAVAVLMVAPAFALGNSTIITVNAEVQTYVAVTTLTNINLGSNLVPNHEYSGSGTFSLVANVPLSSITATPQAPLTGTVFDSSLFNPTTVAIGLASGGVMNGGVLTTIGPVTTTGTVTVTTTPLYTAGPGSYGGTLVVTATP